MRSCHELAIYFLVILVLMCEMDDTVRSRDGWLRIILNIAAELCERSIEQKDIARAVFFGAP
jgi:hypothetical protein